jgi:hypothetical protein
VELRIIKYRDGNFGLHEVHYDDQDQPTAVTENPVRFGCDADAGAHGTIESLNLALLRLKHFLPLDEPAWWKKP